MEADEPFGSEDDDELSADEDFDIDADDDEFSEPDELDFEIRDLVLTDDEELNVVLFELNGKQIRFVRNYLKNLVRIQFKT